MPQSEETTKRVRIELKRREGMLQSLGQFYQHYDDLSNVMLTRREGFVSTTIDGGVRNEDIFDGTPMQGARSLANTTGAMIRPEGEVFVTVKTENENDVQDDAAQFWLSDTTERLDTGMRSPITRFRQATGEVDLDLVVFGTGIISNFLSLNRSNLAFKSVHLKNGIPFFNEAGHAVGMYELISYRIWQLLDRFKKEDLHVDTQKLIDDDKLDEKVVVIHAVTPRDHQKFSNPIFARNFPWADMWIERDREHLIEDGGFNEFPYIVPRWNTSSGEDMGRSPGMVALPDSNTLQAMGETILVAGQRAADPPLMAPNDGFFNEINTFPGGISYYDVETAAALKGKNPFFPLISSSNLPISRDMQSDTRTQVMNAFFKNILNLPVDGPQMTATEIIQRKDEFIREVGPVFGIFETDYNQPLAERSFNIMLREGGFLPIPESLQGKKIKFQFELPVTKIRKQIQAAAVRQWALEQGELVELNPDQRHLVNYEAVGRFSHEALGLPLGVINSPDVFQKKVNADRAAEEQQNKAAEMTQGVEMAATGAKALKDSGLAAQPEAEEKEQSA